MRGSKGLSEKNLASCLLRLAVSVRQSLAKCAFNMSDREAALGTMLVLHRLLAAKLLRRDPARRETEHRRDGG